MTEEKLITVFDTIIQRKDKIDTAATVDQALTELLMAIKDLRECSNVESISTDQNKLIRYGEFLINLADRFDFSKEKHKKEIISNSPLPTGITSDPEEFQEKADTCARMLKIFEYKLVFVSPKVWLTLGGTFEEWLEKSFTRYSYFALFLKLTKVISDYYDLLDKKLDITIPREDRIRFSRGLVFSGALVIGSIRYPQLLINNKEVNCSTEEYRNKVTSLLNYGVSLDCNPDSITKTRYLTEKMFGVSDSICKYVY
jgi:hypothetical protein